jgi:phosphopantetheine adenylyltransferase
MDILDEVVGSPEGDTSLESLITPQVDKTPPPLGSVRNRAATTSLLSDPEKVVDNYGLMMSEAEQGQDVLGSQLRDQVLNNTTQLDMKGVMDILANPKIPMDQKEKAIAAIKQSQFLKDQGNTLFTTSMMKASEGETVEAEDARLSSVDAIREIYESRTKMQGLVNAHAASLGEAGVGTFAEMLELYVMPFGNTVDAGKLRNRALKDELGVWDKIKSFLLPGSATADLRERLESIPPNQRVEFTKKLLDTISQNKGIVFSNDNQFAQYDKALSIFEEGGYGSFQEFLDNVSPLLDAVGIGQVVRGISKVGKVTKATKAAEVVPDFTPKKTTLAEAISSINATDFAPSSKKMTIDDLAVNKPDNVASLLGGSGKKAEGPKRQVPALLKPQTRAERLAQIRQELSDELDRIHLNSVVRQENPASPAAIIQQANPEQARNVHATVVKSEGDAVAEGLYGTSRQQAIVNDVFPQVHTQSGSVLTKAPDIERPLRVELQPPAELIDTLNNTGASYYTKKEKAAARANVVNDFANAEGLTMNEAMSSFNLDGGRIQISAVYGTPEGSFSDPISAFRQAKVALRQYGVTDSEITLLRKNGVDHTPIKLTDEVPEGPGNYLVRVDTYHEIDPTDVGRFDEFDVRLNLFDRIPQLVTKTGGSVTRHLFDAASTLHPIYTGAASVVSDATSRFDKVMLSIADEYASKVTGFSAARKAKIDEYIKEANFKELAFDTTDLVARGFTAPEIDALRSWRKFWDAHYYLENYDVVRTLNADGYQLFRNQTTELYAKPIAKNQNLPSVYDPATDTVIVHSKADGDALYNTGGTYAKLRRPVDFNGVTSEYMIVRNTPTEYLRKFRDSDRVLNYRNGYYQLQYTAPKFVDEVLPGGRTRTVAVAGDTAEANIFADRMRISTGGEYKVRGDERALRRGDDSWWDLNSANGRIAQRHRGKLLEDASGLNHLGDGSYIINPVDSAVRAAKSIAGRTVSRPMLEAAKARFLNQYGRLAPSNGMGGVRWPATVKEIGARGEYTTKELADARTTYEYINYLENGYINGVDDVFKAGLNAIADMLGKKGLSTTERAVTQAGDAAPLSLAKNAVFHAYIGTNFLRQLIIQPHQVVRTFSYNPIGWANGMVEKYAAEYIGNKMLISGETDFVKFVNNSGMMDAVDKNNLVRGTLVDAADSTNKVIRAGARAINLPRKIGFDIGEQANLLGHAAAVYERYKRLGYNLADKAVRDEAYSEIRAISYEMNFAGDMPYNQTSAAMVLQFMQVPHKAFLQMTNRKLDKATRARLLTGDLLLWGPPTLLVGDVLGVDILPDNPALRETFTWGLESYAINAALSKLMEDKTDIDFSSLAPYDMTGWGKFFTAMYSGGLHDLLINSPAGQLFFKDGSRFQTAMASMGRFFGVVEDDQEDPETFVSMMNEVAKISSGYSNAVKAKILLDAQKRLDQYGNQIDKSVNHAEAWAQLFGFGTADTRDLYRMTMALSKDNKSHRDDVLKVYEDVKRYYAEKLGVENTDPKYITKVTGRIMKVFENDPAAKAIIAQKLSEDLAGKDSGLLMLFMKRSGIPDLGGLRDQVKQMPVSDAEKEMMLQRIQDMENARKQMKENK